MTVQRKNDLDKIQIYIKKLQEIKNFLQQAHYQECGFDKMELRVNRYWSKALN